MTTLPTLFHSIAPLDDRVVEEMAYSLVSEPLDTLTREKVASLAAAARVPAARIPALSTRLHRAIQEGHLSGLVGCDLDDAAYHLVASA